MAAPGIAKAIKAQVIKLFQAKKNDIFSPKYNLRTVIE